jgi:hypothetical protein
MMTVQQLLSPLSGAQMRAYAVAALQQLGLQPQNWAPGGVASSVLTVACNILGYVAGTSLGLSQQLANAIAQQWNPTASGGGLQMLSYYFYGFQPPQGTFASGTLVLTNTGGGVYTYAAGQATFASTVANSQGVTPTYTNETGFTLTAWSGSGPFPTVSFEIVCTFSGSAGNSAPGFVTQLVTAMLGVTATNPAPIQGSDPLSDAALRQMNTSSISVASVFGPRSSYAYGIQVATNFVTGNPVNINKWSISIASHTGAVTIYVSSPSGTVDPNDVDGIALCIEFGFGSTDPRFQGARPAGATVGPSTFTVPSGIYAGITIGSPQAAVTVSYAPNAILYVLAPKGTSATTIQAAALAALSTFFSSQANPIGGIAGADDNNTALTGIFESGVSAVLAAGVAIVPGCTMLSSRFSGSSDVALSANQVAVLGMTAANLTINVTYVGT